MPVNFSGKWKEGKKVNIEPMLDLMGIPEDKKEFIVHAEKTAVIDHHGDYMKMTVGSSGGAETMELKLDGSEQEFDDFLRGGKLKMRLFWEGDKLIAKTTMKGRPATVVRYMEGHQMVMDIIIEGQKTSIYWDKA